MTDSLVDANTELLGIKQLMESGKVDEASAALKVLLSRNPDDEVAKMLYGTCRQILGDEVAFRRIYDELQPTMDACEAAGEVSERVSLWKKYKAVFVFLFAMGSMTFGCLAAGAEPEPPPPAAVAATVDAAAASPTNGIAVVAKEDVRDERSLTREEREEYFEALLRKYQDSDSVRAGLASPDRAAAVRLDDRRLLVYVKLTQEEIEEEIEAAQKAPVEEEEEEEITEYKKKKLATMLARSWVRTNQRALGLEGLYMGGLSMRQLSTETLVFGSVLRFMDESLVAPEYGGRRFPREEQQGPAPKYGAGLFSPDKPLGPAPKYGAGRFLHAFDDDF